MTPEAPSADDAANTFVFAFHYTPEEGWRELAADDLAQWPELSGGDMLWVHLNRLKPEASHWMSHVAGLDELVVDALLEEDTRPRATPFADGLIVNMRGVNLNPGAAPEDMLALRIWVTPRLLVTTRAFPIMAARDLAGELRAGHGPASTGAMIADLAERLAARIAPVVEDYDDQLDTLEDALLEGETISRHELSRLRRAALHVRRFMSPQRDALSELVRIGSTLLSEDDRFCVREANNVITRVIETLDITRDRAQLLQEQLVEQRAEAMNQRLFVLSIISAIFLPLSFVTGLFGVNVGGMPGVNSHLAFALLAGAMLLIGLVLLVIFRRLKWL